MSLVLIVDTILCEFNDHTKLFRQGDVSDGILVHLIFTSYIQSYVLSFLNAYVGFLALTVNIAIVRGISIDLIIKISQNILL